MDKEQTIFEFQDAHAEQLKQSIIELINENRHYGNEKYQRQYLCPSAIRNILISVITENTFDPDKTVSYRDARYLITDVLYALDDINKNNKS